MTLEGEQGGFNEVGINGGRPQSQRVHGIGNGNPALSDPEFRKALAHAIDGKTLIEKVLYGLGRPARR